VRTRFASKRFFPTLTLNKENIMATSVARVTEIIASSPKSFEDAFNVGIERANKTLKGVQGAWIKDQKVSIKDGKVVDYRVNIKVTFVLTD
jgi:dodecin